LAQSPLGAVELPSELSEKKQGGTINRTLVQAHTKDYETK